MKEAPPPGPSRALRGLAVRTTCNRDCPDACGILAHVEDGRVVRLQGDPEHPVTRGFLCYRTNHFLPVHYSPERLTTPLVRRAGALVPVGWDEALDFVAERLATIKRESGPSAIFHYRSGGSLGLLKYLSDYFFALFGPVTVKRGDICSGAGDAAQMLDFGEEDSHDLADLLNAKSILLWGKNVFTSSPHTLPVLKEARARGARIVLVDPVHHKTRTIADAFWQPKPAGDFALAMAVARLLFDRGWVDRDAAQYCDNLDEFRALALKKTVAAWCEEADVPEAAAEDLASCFGPNKPAAILVGWGMGRRANGASIVRALDALSAISGNLGIPGGGVSFYFKRRGAFDTDFVKRAGDPPRTILEPLLGEEVLAAKDPPVRAVWITAGNPVTMLPDSNKVAEALRTRELVVVVDSFLTDTARLAHVVLPTTTLLEADDLLGAYGHHYLGVARPVVPPPPGVRSDLEIVQGLAARLGLGDALAGDARAWKERFAKPRLEPKGVTLEALEKGPVRNPLSPKVLFEGRKFATKSGKVNLLTEGAPAALGSNADYPLTMMALSTEDAQSSQWSRTLEGALVATVHPDAAGPIPDGALAELESRIGTMTVRVRHDDKQRRDVVLLPKGGHMKDGRCANALVSARTTDLGVSDRVLP
ncbi:MAG: molybdopterin-dependent oxidoreductase [Polyangiaceae bacterium]